MCLSIVRRLDPGLPFRSHQTVFFLRNHRLMLTADIHFCDRLLLEYNNIYIHPITQINREREREKFESPL
jgi:hypothetical protein